MDAVCLKGEGTANSERRQAARGNIGGPLRKGLEEEVGHEESAGGPIPRMERTNCEAGLFADQVDTFSWRDPGAGRPG